MKPMRHCSIAQVEQFARRELSPTEMRRLEVHLELCPQCLGRLGAEAASILGLRMMDKIRKIFPSPEARRNQKAE